MVNIVSVSFFKIQYLKIIETYLKLNKLRIVKNYVFPSSSSQINE